MVSLTVKPQIVVRGAGKRLFQEWRQHKEMLLCGPGGSAKSMSVAFFLDFMCRTHPKLRVLVFRKTRVDLTESWMQTFYKALMDPYLYLFKEYGENPPDWAVEEMRGTLYARNGHLFQGPSDATRRSYNYRNGSRIVLGGMNNPTRLFSTEYDIAYCNEANELNLGDWESIRRALRNRVLDWHPFIADCNPDHPGHWLRKRFRSGRTTLFNAPHTDNPWLTGSEEGRQYLHDMDTQLTGVRRRRLFLNEWAGAENMVYLDFEAWDEDDERESAHVIEADLHKDSSGAWWLDIKTPKAKARKVKLLRFIGAQDWGHVNPAVQQVWGLDAEGRMYLVQEHYQTGRRIDWWADVAAANFARFRFQPILCDHDTGNIEAFNDRLGTPGGRDVARIAIEAEKEVQSGLDHVRDRLVLAEDGLPRIFFVRGALVHEPDPTLTGADVLASLQRPASTEEEIPNYRNREVEDDAEDIRRDDPIKKDDHGCDAMRYACFWAWRRLPKEKERVEPYPVGSIGATFKSHRRRGRRV